MNNIIKSAITLSVAAAALILPVIPASAAIHSKSKELVVMTPQDLPEQAQIKGNSLLLHSDNAGSTYLYVEQQEGKRISVFDVTDPSRIRLAVSTEIPDQGPFDFIRALSDNAELVYFRDGQKVGILNLRKAKKPELHTVATAANLITAERLGQSGMLATETSYTYAPAVARDFQVIDISSANLAPLAVVRDVKHRATNDETGTMFLLGSDGLTVVRRLSVEREHEIHEMQMQGN
jgi:hypothetical protein